MFDDNGENFIATLYNVLLAPDLCDRLFSIITLMNAGHTCLFNKGFCTVHFGAKEDNAVTLPHSAVRKHPFMVKSMGSSKKNPKRNSKRKKIALELHSGTRLNEMTQPDQNISSINPVSRIDSDSQINPVSRIDPDSQINPVSRIDPDSRINPNSRINSPIRPNFNIPLTRPT